MSRTMFKRLERLEQRNPPTSKVHVVFGDIGGDDEALDRKVEAFKVESPDYRDTDMVIAVRWVSPGEVVA